MAPSCAFAISREVTSMVDRINFGKLADVISLPDLIEIQTSSYKDFLQMDVAPTRRRRVGLQTVFKEVAAYNAASTGKGVRTTISAVAGTASQYANVVAIQLDGTVSAVGLTQPLPLLFQVSPPSSE